MAAALIMIAVLCYLGWIEWLDYKREQDKKQ